jgi:replicative DNA helicase
LYADDEGKKEKKGEAHLIIAKQRNGPTGKIDLTFRGEYTRFEDHARIDEADIPSFEGGEE